MDIKTILLNDGLEEEIYMNQPEGFIVKGQKKKMCKLMKSVYILKQVPKEWHQKFDRVIQIMNSLRMNMISVYIPK